MAAGQGSEPLIAPPGLGPMSSELGRDPEGKSLRIAAAMKAAEDATKEVTGENPSQIDQLATEVDAALKSIGEGEISQEAMEMAMEGGRRRKARGGDKRSKVGELGTAVPSTTTSKTEYLKKIGAAILEYAQREIAPIGPSGMAVATGAVGLAQEVVVRVPVTLVTLTLSGTALSVKFFRALFAKFNSWGRTSAERLRSDLSAEQAADAAVKDIPSIAKTAAVGVVFFNQLGLLPLSAVLAAILFAVKANVSTGPARSLLISQFYAWYIMKTPKEQAAFLQNAKTYAAAAASTGRAAVNASAPVAAAVADFMSKAGVGVASAASSFASSSSSSSSAAVPAAAAASVLAAGAEAAAVVGQVVVEQTAEKGEDTINESIAQVKSPQAVVAVGNKADEGVTTYISKRRPLGSSSSSSPSSVSPPPARPSRFGPVASSEPPSRETRSSLKRKFGESEPSPGKKDRGGKRRTKRKLRVKRRRTYRRAIVPSGMFAY